ncbi:MAG: PAC2 family protein [Nanoarchaeota archaeon]|nr:PAC2 family protein [Nanoarchaeota archaeon]
MWKFTPVGKKPKLHHPILMVGLPGIGNVGKITVDFLVDNLKAKKIYDIFSYTFPNSVFVTENNLIELISMSIFHKNVNGKDILFLAGDVQPTEDVASYEFCDEILKIMKAQGCKEIVTIGGIGLSDLPNKPKVYITGNSRKFIDEYKKGIKVNDKIYGIVGPIIGISGLLAGLGGKFGIDVVCLLAETFGHPMYIGAKGARVVLKALDIKLGLELDFKSLDKEIKEMESDLMKRVSDLEDLAKQKTHGESTSYIG